MFHIFERHQEALFLKCAAMHEVSGRFHMLDCFYFISIQNEMEEPLKLSSSGRTLGLKSQPLKASHIERRQSLCLQLQDVDDEART